MPYDHKDSKPLRRNDRYNDRFADNDNRRSGQRWRTPDFDHKYRPADDRPRKPGYRADDSRPRPPRREDRPYSPRADRPQPPRPPRPPRDSRPAPFGSVDTDPLARLMNQEVEQPQENLLVGRNPIREALKSGRDLEKLMVARGELSGSAREIVARAKEAGIVVQEVDRARLDAIYKNHQGMIAFASSASYSSMDDIFAAAQEKNQPPFIIVLDGITDPHNLGAIIRTAECAGAHGVIIPERRNVGLTPAAVKASAGACEYVPVVRVTNINRALDELKAKGVWIMGTDTQGEDALSSDLTGPIALVIGAEGEGIAPLTLSKCDKTLSLPMAGRIDSLNASVAAGVLMYAVVSARRG